MCLQQKEAYLCQLQSLKLIADSQHTFGSTVAISLPKIKPCFSRNKNTCFKEYENGTKIINQLPLLMFNSDKKNIPKKNTFLRYKTEQKTQERFESVSPFFKNYIRKSLQKRKIQEETQNFTSETPKRCLMQVVSLDVISLNLNQTPKQLIKPPIKKPEISFMRYQASPKLRSTTTNHIKNLESGQASENQELQIQKKEIKLTKTLPRPILQIKCKLASQRRTSLKQKEEDVSPWVLSGQTTSHVLDD